MFFSYILTGMKGSFFDEWIDDRRLFPLVFIVLTGQGILFTHWISSTYPSLQHISDIFFGMLIISTIIAMVDFIQEKNNLTSFLYQGFSRDNLLFSLFLGVLAGFILYSLQFIFGFSSSSVQNVDPLTGFVFVVIVASYCEELFFRCSLQPTFYTFLNNLIGVKNRFVNGILATISVSAIFAFYHYSILGLSTSLVFPFIFGLIATVGNYWRKSVFFGIGLHVILNYLWFSTSFGLPF